MANVILRWDNRSSSAGIGDAVVGKGESDVDASKMIPHTGIDTIETGLLGFGRQCFIKIFLQAGSGDDLFLFGVT